MTEIAKEVLNQSVQRALGPRVGAQVVEPLFAAPFPAALLVYNAASLVALLALA